MKVQGCKHVCCPNVHETGSKLWHNCLRLFELVHFRRTGFSLFECFRLARFRIRVRHLDGLYSRAHSRALVYLAVLRIWAQLRSYVIYERCLDGVDHVGTARGGEDKADSVTSDEATGGCMVRSARLRSSVSLFVSAWSMPSIRRLVAVAISGGHQRLQRRRMWVVLPQRRDRDRRRRWRGDATRRRFVLSRRRW